MLFTILIVVQALVAAALVTVILMQQSEGSGITGGSNPGGLMSASGAANFLTRATGALAVLFVVLSIALAALASVQNTAPQIDISLAHKPVAQQTAPAQPAQPKPSSVPLADQPATTPHQ
ncbi:MAG: preprotein translocase subunit SecG [Zymomonas mobilis]|uniref:preprotein translocase subunit SecG n=1 Tax=Zymomonas mobilis TaxID=542 RepID=UPI0001B7042B|nr:preprotein translocase subunit SecG [Zymomonas mobilis]ACV75335.1 preprotein translocase, SecG subunit [Zymomonas mobilis subsp. mobilis NCIMB 11163]